MHRILPNYPEKVHVHPQVWPTLTRGRGSGAGTAGGDGSLRTHSCPHFTERENNCFPFPSPCRHRDTGMQAGINQSSSQADEVYFTLKKWPTLRCSRGSLIFGRQALWPPELAQVGPELAGPRQLAPNGLIARSGCQIAPSRRRHC